MSEDPDDAESLLLVAIWDRLERALELATDAKAMAHLAEVSRLCAEVTRLIADR